MGPSTRFPRIDRIFVTLPMAELHTIGSIGDSSVSRDHIPVRFDD